jgi:WhiB family redox-sensing transcriptional regulator
MNYFDTLDKNGNNLAVCADEQADPDWWFEPWFVELAVAKCGKCPLAKACLKYAIQEGMDLGVWGGLTEDQRRSLRKHRKITPDNTTQYGRKISPFQQTR